MKRKFIIQQVVETWANELPIDEQSGVSIVTKEGIANLSEQLASHLDDATDIQTGNKLSALVQLYIKSRFDHPVNINHPR